MSQCRVVPFPNPSLGAPFGGCAARRAQPQDRSTHLVACAAHHSSAWPEAPSLPACGRRAGTGTSPGGPRLYLASLQRQPRVTSLWRWCPRPQFCLNNATKLLLAARYNLGCGALSLCSQGDSHTLEVQDLTLDPTPLPPPPS